MPRPRKAHNLKVVAGTARPDRIEPTGVELPLIDAAPLPPDWLPNIHAQKEWERLAPILCANKLLTEASLSTLGMLCAPSGLPVVTVAAMFQKDPLVLIAHDDVKSFADMKTKTLLIAPIAYRSFWPWLKAKYGFIDAQTRPYTFNIQPFVADPNLVQQGYVTSEPYAIRKAGVKINTFLLADYGYPGYSTTVSCLEKTIRQHRQAVAAFVRASAEGWKSYLADPAPGNALIRKENPNLGEDQLAYSMEKMKRAQLVTGGDAARLGIGIITDARMKASWDFMVSAGLIDPAKVALAQTYTTAFVKDLKVLP